MATVSASVAQRKRTYNGLAFYKLIIYSHGKYWAEKEETNLVNGLKIGKKSLPIYARKRNATLHGQSSILSSFYFREFNHKQLFSIRSVVFFVFFLQMAEILVFNWKADKEENEKKKF